MGHVTCPTSLHEPFFLNSNLVYYWERKAPSNRSYEYLKFDQVIQIMHQNLPNLSKSQKSDQVKLVKIC